MGLGGLLARLTAIILVVGVIAYCAGFLLPSERTIVSESVILAPPEEVFDKVTDVKGQAVWRDDVADIDFDEKSNPRSWSETSSGWRLKFTEVMRNRPTEYEVEFESPSGFYGRRTYRFEPTESGDRTRFTRTDVYEIGNPLRRVYSYLMVNIQSIVDNQGEDLGYEFMKEPFAAPAGESATATGSPSTPASDVPRPSGPTAPSATPTAAGTLGGTAPGSAAPGGTALPVSTVPATATPTTSPIPTGIPAATPTASPSVTPRVF